MAVAPNTKTGAAGSKALNVAIWIAQVLIAVAFCLIGFIKLTTPIPQLSHMMAWTGQYPEAFVRSIGLIDIAGGLGVLLPAATRIWPRLTVLAALCCAVLQILAIAFHISRGEASLTPLNFILLPLVLFILWGRGIKSPIGPR